MANQEYTESSSSEEMNWISDWCDEPCNRFFCEVPTAYILDEFNLYGLQQYFDHTYDAALSRILDEDDFSEDAKISEDIIELNAQKLYGMIHARFLTTSQGLRTLRYKVKRKHYGTCPRVLCPEQPLIPCGLTERFGKDTVRLYCPRCEHIYLVNHPSKGCLNLTHLLPLLIINTLYLSLHFLFPLRIRYGWCVFWPSTSTFIPPRLSRVPPHEEAGYDPNISPEARVCPAHWYSATWGRRSVGRGDDTGR